MPSAIELANQLSSKFPDLVSTPVEFRGEASVSVRDFQRVPEVLEHAKNHLDFEMLLDISSVDHLGEEPRFEMVYHLYSFRNHQYLRIKTRIGAEKPEVPTVSKIWKAANWHEREIYDMMGIRFTGHPDLRRILMWEGYSHFPLRKEFPLAGIPSEDGRTHLAPMAGGPFVTRPGKKITEDREPRAKGESNARVEFRKLKMD